MCVWDELGADFGLIWGWFGVNFGAKAFDLGRFGGIWGRFGGHLRAALSGSLLSGKVGPPIAPTTPLKLMALFFARDVWVKCEKTQGTRNAVKWRKTEEIQGTSWGNPRKAWRPLTNSRREKTTLFEI